MDEETQKLFEALRRCIELQDETEDGDPVHVLAGKARSVMMSAVDILEARVDMLLGTADVEIHDAPSSPYLGKGPTDG